VGSAATHWRRRRIGADAAALLPACPPACLLCGAPRAARSELPQARLVAAAIPTLNLVRLLLVGSGALPDPGLVKSVSRQGDRSELLKGPLYYCLVLLGVTLAFWRTNPAGLIAVSMMCGGDGFADIVGRRLGGAKALKLPWNASKSWPGSAAMFLAGLGMSAGFFALFCSLGFFECFSARVVLPYLAAVCAACTLVESLPINSWFDDNLSVPLVAIGTSLAVLPAAAAASAACKASPSLAQLHWLC
jgi:phytol kinase